MNKGYQFELVAKKLTEGAVRFGNAAEELCQSVYMRKGIVKLMPEVFPNGMPPGITVTIEANYDAKEDIKQTG